MSYIESTMNLIRLNDICANKQVLVCKLRTWGLIPQEGEYMCPKCGGVLTLAEDASRIDGWKWRCFNYKAENKKKRRRCLYAREFRHGTFFSKTKLSILKVLGFVNLWVSNAPLTLIMEQLEIAKNTSINWASFCREVLFETFFANPLKLGGPGKIVEIDDSKFGKRKCHRGHHVEGQWVFGGYERGSGKVFMVAVEQRDTDTLLPIIEKWIEKGTTIYSDCWKAYNCLSANGYQHLSVNHSINFKDAETGVHTNGIPENLARYMFYKKCSELNLNRTEEFLKLAGEMYDPRKEEEMSIHVADDEEISELDEDF